MAQLTREEEMRVLESAGIDIQRTNSDTHYFEAIGENSPVLHDAASLVYGLMEKYAALDVLVKQGFRTPKSASHEFVSQLQRAREDVKEWGTGQRRDREVNYASKILSEVITKVLRQCDAESRYATF